MKRTVTMDFEKYEEMRRWSKYGRIIAGLIHNLNTPLMGITGRIELLQFKFSDVKGFDQISTQLQRINDMLSGVSFVLDKDINQESYLTDVNETIQQLDVFMRGDMKYKHKMDVSLDLNDAILLEMPPTLLVNAVHELLRLCVNKGADDSVVVIATKKVSNLAVISITSSSAVIEHDLSGTIEGDLPLTDIDEDTFTLWLVRWYCEKLKADFEMKKTDQGNLFTIRIPIPE